MKRNQTLRRGLGILLSLVMCLSLLPMTVLAAETPMNIGDVVAENQPFVVNLGENQNPVSTVKVCFKKNGAYTEEYWIQSEQFGQDWEIQNNCLTVGGKYVSSSDEDSMVGMMLTGVEYNYLEIPFVDGEKTFNIKFQQNSEGVYVYVGTDGSLDVTQARVDLDENMVYVKYEDQEDETCACFDPDAARITILTFENFPKLPTTDPLEAGVYYHYLVPDFFIIHNVYAVVYDKENGYKPYSGSEDGANFDFSFDDPNSTVTKLTVRENSVLKGATFTGEEYLADMVTFTSQYDSSKQITRLVYRDGEDYKCIDDNGAIKKGLQCIENDGPGCKLRYDEEYYALEELYYPYVLYSRVLFFNAAGSSTAPYTVTFDANGGTLISEEQGSTKTEPDGTVDYLNAATREGYTFDGWYTEKTGGEKVYTYVTVFTANTTVYAHWTPAAQTKQITEASFAMKGYTVGANAKDIVITSNTEGLSLTGGYFEALGQPFSYLIAVVAGADYDPVTGPLKANTEYILMLKADVNAGYDVGSELTKDKVTLNSTIPAAECGENKEESTLGITFVLPVLKDGDTAPAKHTVTVNDSYASTTGAGDYEEGTLVTLAAGSRSGYTFSGWTSNDITIPNASSADTSFVMPAKNVTVTANWTRTGGGSSSDPTYSVTSPEKIENGTVTISPKNASAGTEVTITVTPDQGCVLENLVITDKDGKEIKLTDKGSGKYTFAMPASKVTVNASFTTDSPKPVNSFTDVPNGAYYEDAVIWAVSEGITSGTTATTFSPDASCTRAQMVTFLWRAAGSPAPQSSVNPFTDVAADAYYYDAVLWAVENGITSGTSATTFAPDATCTRAQTVTFLYRAAGSPEVSGSGFSDVSSDAYYADAVAWAVQQNITTGTGDGQFSPNADCTRAQIVTFLFRAMGE